MTTCYQLTLPETIMTSVVHRSAAVVALMCIATFLSATVFVELLGSPEEVATVKRLILWPGLLILIPAIALTGASGFTARRAITVDSETAGKEPLLRRKQKRMPFIAANGLLVLIPCAFFLDAWASAGRFDATFYAVQGLELLAGATNLLLMGLNARDGLRFAAPAH